MITFLDKALGKWIKPTTDKGLPVSIVGTGLILPTDTQARATSTIVTHNAASIAANTSSIPSTWIDTQDPANPFTAFDLTLLNDAAANSSLDLYWSNDGTTIHGINSNVLPAGTVQRRAYDADKSIICNARWLKVVPTNLDTSAAHTMTVTIYTKA
jgi:hypothetical protein